MPASTQAQQHPASRVASKRHAPWLVHRCVGAVSSCLQQAERFLALPTRLLRLRPLLLALATRCSVAVACGEKGRNALFLVTRSVPSVTGSRTARQPARRTTTNAHAASSPYLPVAGLVPLPIHIHLAARTSTVTAIHGERASPFRQLTWDGSRTDSGRLVAIFCSDILISDSKVPVPVVCIVKATEGCFLDILFEKERAPEKPPKTHLGGSSSKQ